MRGAKNTPTLTLLETMRVLLMLLVAALAAATSPARAGCNEPAGCREAVPAVAASADPVYAPPVLVAQLPGEVVPAVAPAAAGAPARVAANLSDARPEAVRAAGERGAAGEQARAESRPPAGSESSSVWLMLFAGLAFAGFVVVKRSRG